MEALDEEAWGSGLAALNALQLSLKHSRSAARKMSLASSTLATLCNNGSSTYRRAILFAMSAASEADLALKLRAMRRDLRLLNDFETTLQINKDRWTEGFRRSSCDIASNARCGEDGRLKHGDLGIHGKRRWRGGSPPVSASFTARSAVAV